MKAKTLLAVVAALASMGAMAGDFYGTAGVGVNNLRANVSQVGVDSLGTGTVLKLGGGYQFLPQVAVEAAYTGGVGLDSTNLGASNDVKAQELSLALVGKVPLAPHVSAISRFGVAHTHLGGALSGSKNNLLVGFGAEYAMSNDFALRAEYEVANDFGRSGQDLQRLTVSAVQRF